MVFTKNEVDPNLYFKLFGIDPLILVMYVDDLFVTSVEDLITGHKVDLASEFEMKDIGLMHYFLGLEVCKVSGEIFFGQGKYAIEILRRFRMEDCKLMDTPMITNIKKVINLYSNLVDPRIYMNFIGSLMYLVKTRPNMCLFVKTLIQFMVEQRKVHWV
jgi:hypothetical protein